MTFFEIPFWNIEASVNERVTEFLLSMSDTAEFLSSDQCGIYDLEELCGTEYEDMISACTASRLADSYGVKGTIYKFNLTDKLKELIRKNGLLCMFYDGKKILLENLNLLKSDKAIFSCCSHEGMSDIDDEYREDIIKLAETAVRELPIYNEMHEIYNRLPKTYPAKFKKDLTVLWQLASYVDKEKNYWIYTPPTYPCKIERYRKIAERYLRKQTVAPLYNAKNFAALHPVPVPVSVDDVLSGKFGKENLQFMNSDIYFNIKRELCYIEYFADKEKGL